MSFFNKIISNTVLVLLVLFVLFAPKSVFSQSNLSLQGVIDFTTPSFGNTGKAIHVKALQNIADLSIYGIGVANNGGGSDGEEYNFDPISVLAGEDILVARDVSVISSYFSYCFSEFDHVLQANTNISQNGDDAIELFMNGLVVETFGDVNVDGTGEPWEYLDSWAYKINSGTTGSFVLGDWSFGGINCTDGSTTIYDASCLYPICPLKTYVPDDNFENYLESNGMGDGIAFNDSVLTSNINTVTNLQLFFLSITDLTGIEDFMSLTNLNTEGNSNLTAVDISQNTLLVDARFNQCNLNSLDVSNNPLLSILAFGGNNVSSIDVSNNPLLTNLDCWNNSISTLDLSQNTALTSINCNANQISSLDFTNNPNMINISCNSNLLTTLDVTNLSLLQILWCPGNNISVLDLSQNSQLNTIRCENNTLHRLDVKNGNNTNVTQFFSTGNPSLECINVDDSTYSANNWTNIDSQQYFGESCYCTLNIDSQTNVSCYGGYDGALVLSGSGGSGFYNYALGFLNQFTGTLIPFTNTGTGFYALPISLTNVPANCYTAVMTDSLGCADTTNICVTQPDSIYSITTMTQCNQVIWNFNIYNSSGTYSSVLTASNGCDSTAILNVTLIYSDTSYTNVTACNSYTWNGATYTTSGSYFDVSPGSNGCDSIAILNLIIDNSPVTSTVTVTSCDSYAWDGVTYTTTGQYTNVYTSLNGCDSTVTLDLTINNSFLSTVTVTSCDSYVWDGVTYTSTGQYTNVYTALNGCDSTVTLDLTINNSSSSTVTVTSCDSYDWDGVTYTSTGQYTNVYTGLNGCDSTATLDLTINNSSISTVTVTSCDSYDWDGVTYTSTGQYTNVYTGLNGCDSTVTLDLTINNSSTSTVTVTSCDSYDWDGVTYTTTGQYTNVYTGLNSCDSTVTLDLTVNQTDTTFLTVSVCDSFILNNVTYNQTGVYYQTVSADSIIGFNYAGSYDGSTYYISENPEYWSVAQSNSILAGGNLVCISDANENDFVSNILPGQQFWLGYTDETTEGSFVWVDGSSYTYTKWAPTEPSNSGPTGNEDYTLINSGEGGSNPFDGFWNDVDDNLNQYLYVMEIPNSHLTSNGCDSVIALNLTINVSDTSYTNITACDSIEWNGEWYDSSGTYYYNSGGVANTNSLSFDGNDDYIQIPDASVNNLSSGTIMTWVKLDDNTSETILCKQSDGENTYATLSIGSYANSSGHGSLGDPGRVYFHSKNFNPIGSSTNLVSNGVYTHVAVTFNQDSVSFYIDGQFSGTTLGNFSIPNDLTVTYTRIGFYNVQGSYNLDGKLDDVSIWSYILTQGEIQDYINCSPLGNETNLVAFWNFNEGSGNTVFDQSPNGNDGSIFGPFYNTNVPLGSCQLTNSNGCDSVAVLDLTINNSSTSTVTVTSCDSFDWNGVTYTTTGQYTNVYTGLNGCDSTVTLDLTINNSSTSTVTITSCDSFDWDGVTYTSTGQYTNVYTALNGCDSTVTLDLIINNSYFYSDTVTACDSYIFSFYNGLVYDSSGNYTDTLTTINGCDSIINLVLSINYSYSNIDTVSACSSYVWYGQTYFISGEYDTLFTNSNGCDSLFSLNLTIVNNTSSLDTVVTCDSYDWNGNTYYSSGYYDSLFTNYVGCDSLAMLFLTINQSDTSYSNITSCDSVEWNGEWYDSSGTYSYSGTNIGYSMSFDGNSDVSVNANSIFDFSLNQKFSIQAYVKAQPNGGYIFQGEFGFGYSLLVGPTPEVVIWNGTTGIGCSGSTDIRDNQWHNIVGVFDGSVLEIYVDGNLENTISAPALVSRNGTSDLSIGCHPSFGNNHPDNFDGLIYDVSVWEIALTQQEIQSYMNCSPSGNEIGLVGYWNFEEGSGNTVFDQTSNGNDGTINGATYDTNVPAQSCQLTNSNGCDSVAVLNLIINNSSTSTVTVTSCDSYAWDGVTYTTTGQYTNVYTALNGCDSTVTLDLTINNSSTSSVTVTSCDSYDWDGVTYTSTGQYTNVYNALNGCDSTVTLDLTINNSSSSTVTITSCDSYDWDGVTYTSTGQYTNVYTSLNGCDSVAVLNLTINNSSTSTVTVTSCDSYDWDGVIYTTTGQYINVYTALNGCDSTVTLDLTINNSSTSTVTITACDSYDWDGVTYTTTGQYTNVYTALNGCDSTVTLDLTINNSLASLVVVSVCGFYIWDGVTYDSTGLYTNLYTALNGCDSTVTLDLTINNSSTSTVTITSCDSFDWDGITYDSTGFYTNIYADINGCDSTVNLDLTILYSSFSMIVVNACDSFIWDGIAYYTTGIYSNIYNAQNGCDSLVTLDLNINSPISNIDTNNICTGDSVIVGNSTYYISGNYLDTVVSTIGCDSIYFNTTVIILPSGCTDTIALNYDSLAQCEDYSCIMPIYGCLDTSAINYYSGANYDDGSCIYAGCTDSTANNFNPNATIDDGSCVYTLCLNPSPNGLYTNNITDHRVTINWMNMNSNDCMVWKYYVRYREIGTNTWITKSAGVGSGLCNVGLNTITKVLKNLSPSTSYEYKMKAFYCGGTESSYSQLSQFTTEDPCPEMSNLSTQTFYFNPNKVRFSWDTTGLYTFARIVFRIDTSGSSWQNVGGFGIYYPSLSINKYGLNPGQFYRAQGRTFCDSNITSYRSWWTPPIFWQQPSQIRLIGGNEISELDIYPNPSRDLFNISFNSQEIQDLEVRIISLLGKEIYKEDLVQFVGEYTKSINLNEFEKSVYFLEIITDNGIINKKLILQ